MAEDAQDGVKDAKMPPLPYALSPSPAPLNLKKAKPKNPGSLREAEETHTGLEDVLSFLKAPE